MSDLIEEKTTHSYNQIRIIFPELWDNPKNELELFLMSLWISRQSASEVFGAARTAAAMNEMQQVNVLALASFHKRAFPENAFPKEKEDGVQYINQFVDMMDERARLYLDHLKEDLGSGVEDWPRVAAAFSGNLIGGPSDPQLGQEAQAVFARTIKTLLIESVREFEERLTIGNVKDF